MKATTIRVDYEDVTCVTCGLSWLLPKTFATVRRNDQKTFRCPNGHKLWFPGGDDSIETAGRRIRDDIVKLAHEKEQLEAKVEKLRTTRRKSKTPPASDTSEGGAS